MNKRPTQLVRRIVVNPEAFDHEEYRNNFGVIYSGNLADGRALDGAEGVYTARVVAPLHVTDDGIALNLQDPVFLHQITTVVQSFSGGTFTDPATVKVDDGDVADYLENQIVSYDGEVEHYVGVKIIKPAAHSPLQGRILTTDLDGWGIRYGGASVALSQESLIHFLGTETYTATLDAHDWRTYMVRAWGRTALSLEDLQDLDRANGTAWGRLWPNFTTGPLDPNRFIFVKDTLFPLPHAVSWQIEAEEPTGILKITITPLETRVYRGAWAIGSTYMSTQVVTSGGYNWQSMHDDNIGADPATDDGSNWTIYEIPEAYIYYRLDVLGVVPLSVMEQLGNVWTVA